jgi:uncharacterized protein (TIGR00730 family)
MTAALQNITVYCASSDYVSPHFHDAAEQLGRRLAAEGLTLVYGAGSVGLMGVLARAVQAGGGQVIGVITQRLITAEQLHRGCDETVIVDTMRERKAIMGQRGDAVVVLPGGVGTLEEFFEILVGRLVGEHTMPIALVNIDGYFDPLLAMFDHAVAERFAKAAVRDLFIVADDVDEAMAKLLNGDGHIELDDSMLPSGPLEAGD